MLQAAEELDFERAAALRDHIKELKASPELKVAAADARPAAPVARGSRSGGTSAKRDSGAWTPRGQHRRPTKRKS